MDIPTLLALLALVALGSYVQTASGFAMGLIVVGGAALFNVVPIAFAANIVSVVGLVNIATALHRQYRHINVDALLPAAVGVLLLTGAGLYLLHYLSAHALVALEILLGATILLGGVALMLHPQPLARPSPPAAHFAVGAVGGLVNGMFSAGSPPLAMHLYRQPLPFHVIRATLLAVFGVMDVLRLAIVGATGHFTPAVLVVAALCAPVTVAVTMLARRFPPPLTDRQMRRAGFALLVIIGLGLIA